MTHVPTLLGQWRPTNPFIDTAPESGYLRKAPGPNAIIVDLAERDSILAWTLHAAAQAHDVVLLAPPHPDDAAQFAHVPRAVDANIEVDHGRTPRGHAHEPRPAQDPGETRHAEWVDRITVCLTLANGSRHLSAPATLSEALYDQFEGIDVPLGVVSRAEPPHDAQRALERLWSGYAFAHDDPGTDVEEAYRAFHAECTDQAIRAVHGERAATEAQVRNQVLEHVLPLLGSGERLVLSASAASGIERLQIEPTPPSRD